MSPRLSILTALMFILCCSAGMAQNSMDPELIGCWTTKTQEGGMGFLCVRPDGLALFGSSVGAAGPAAYDPKERMLTVSLRDVTEAAHPEVARMTLCYDPKERTLRCVRMILYSTPMNPLPKPREQHPDYTFVFHSKELPGFAKELDLKSVLPPAQK